MFEFDFEVFLAVLAVLGVYALVTLDIKSKGRDVEIPPDAYRAGEDWKRFVKSR